MRIDDLCLILYISGRGPGEAAGVLGGAHLQRQRQDNPRDGLEDAWAADGGRDAQGGVQGGGRGRERGGVQVPKR